MRRRRAFALSILWTAVTIGLIAMPGCYGRNCDPGFYSYGLDAGEGHMVSADEWESAPINSKWLFFPGNHTYFFEFRQMGGRIPIDIEPYVSGSPDPINTPGADLTPASGNLAILSGWRENHVDVHNSSCSNYYLRITARAAPFPPAAPVPGEASDAGVRDATTD